MQCSDREADLVVACDGTVTAEIGHALDASEAGSVPSSPFVVPTFNEAETLDVVSRVAEALGKSYSSTMTARTLRRLRRATSRRTDAAVAHAREYRAGCRSGD